MALTPDSCRLGSLLGCLIGDALGGPLEFKPKASEERLKAALRMEGGGVWDLGPGQVTDDGELALCLAQGLARSGVWDCLQSFPAEQVAAMYAAWYASDPFDVGGTCRAAFQSSEGGAAGMRARAHSRSSGSKANGALMRAAPLALWLPSTAWVQAVADCARQDAQLSHPNQTCQDVNAAYCLAIWHLVNHPGDAQGALDLAVSWARQYAVPEVRQWLDEDSRDIRNLDVTNQAGFAKWAFVLAFHHLRHRTPLVEALTHTVCMAGDPDTNAAIVGGLLGALHGFHAIPPAMVRSVMNYTYDSAGRGRPRPAFLTPRLLLPSLVAHWPWLQPAVDCTEKTAGNC